MVGRLLVMSLLVLLISACAESGGTQGEAGGPCRAASPACDEGLTCIDSICMRPATADGDSDGESPLYGECIHGLYTCFGDELYRCDEHLRWAFFMDCSRMGNYVCADSRCRPANDADGDIPIDGDLPDGDLPDGDLPDGDLPDGDLSDGDVPDGDLPDGDVPDGDVPDGDSDDVDTDIDIDIDIDESEVPGDTTEFKFCETVPGNMIGYASLCVRMGSESVEAEQQTCSPCHSVEANVPIYLYMTNCNGRELVGGEFDPLSADTHYIAVLMEEDEQLLFTVLTVSVREATCEDVTYDDVLRAIGQKNSGVEIVAQWPLPLP